MSRYTYFSLFFVVVAVSLFSSHVVYNEYKESQVKAAKSLISSQAEHNAKAFEAWLFNRQNEMRLIANHQAAKVIDKKELIKLLVNTADLNGHYDTIFFIDLEGRGVVGVDYKKGESRILPNDEVHAFYVQDRDWFKSVSEGKDTFSEPLISRATGLRVSTVSVPIFDGDRFVGIIRGAVNLTDILTFVENIYKEESSEVFLVDERGHFITSPSALLNGQLKTESEIVEHLRVKNSWTGIYVNDFGDDVIGTVVKVPILGWGLVYEVNKLVALEDVHNTYKDMIILAGLGLLFAVMVFSVFLHDPRFQATQRGLQVPYGPDDDLSAEEIISKLSQINHNLEDGFDAIHDIYSRVKINSLEVEQYMKDHLKDDPKELDNVLSGLQISDTKLKKAQLETKGLILEQSWLIEKMNKLIRNI